MPAAIQRLLSINMASIGAAAILDVIEFLAEVETSCSLTNIASNLGLAKSSCLRLLKILIAKHYVELTHEGRYRLVRLPGTGGMTKEQQWLLEISMPTLKWAAEVTGISAFIAVATPSGNLKYITKILPDNQEVVYDRDISKLRKMNLTASGLCLLAHHNTQEEIDPKLSADIRQNGLAVNLNGTIEGASGAAAPIFDVNGNVIAAFNLSGPRFNVVESLDKIKDTVIQGAQKITQLIAAQAK